MANKQTLTGAFVLGGFGLALGAILLFGQFNPFVRPVRAVVIFQGSASGLSVGSPVTFRGVRVGSVSNISLEFDRKAYAAFIPVTLDLQPGRVRLAHDSVPLQISDLIRHGLRAEVNVQSFVTGQSQIELDFDSSSPAILHPGFTNLPEIPARQSVIQKAQQTLAQLPLKELATNAEQSLASIRQLADKMDHDLPPLIVSVQQTSEHSRALVDATTKTLADLQAQLTTTLQGIDRLTTAGTQQLASRGADLHRLLVNTNGAVVEARQTLAVLRQLASPRSPERANLQSILRDLSAASASMRGFASDIERNPQLLLTGRKS
jgi:paraquat-inducible protein B